MRTFKKTLMLIVILVIILITVVGFSLYHAPVTVVKNYIHQGYDTNPKLINDEIVKNFLLYNKQNNLPEPTIHFKTVNHTMKTAQILANFEIFIYDSENNPTNIYSGSLLFSLVYSNWSWEIDSIEVMKEMGK
jgi:hypothetical protein